MIDSNTIFTLWNRSIASLMNASDEPDFPKKLVSSITQFVEIESVMLVLEQKDHIPILLYDAGIPDHERALYIDAYFSGAYLLDPFCLYVEEGIKEGFYHLSEIAPDDFYASEYYKTYYEKTSLLDDVYFVTDLEEGLKFSFAMGRQVGHQHFGESDFLFFRAIEPVIQTLMKVHWKQVIAACPHPTDDGQRVKVQVDTAFKNFGKSFLTDRERQVAHLLLKGHSSKSAAKKLEISPDTVQMHRKNMYAKLEITSHSELFSLFIGALSQVHSASSDDPLTSVLPDKTDAPL
jgi:DNA-binding CsgD family transcriptional regulator